MKKLIKLMLKFGKRHSYNITLKLDEDGSGCILHYITENEITCFNSIEELEEILKSK